ncbi:unnamed protein product [Medioppia subpectinata]|uniref:Nuclear speckle splicing regulatory protein 1 N-terminal domain-containing protein n=1 Tax=Medioppia subpectinata TaxID=1979941 RepID=A0A7R9KEK5_9ACAR|nr:unnamed protein product [Medioppia subpectinata]CAG2100706.1 unnamed protein product [Medioppia subpectinata]
MEDKKYGLIRLSKTNKPVNTLKKNIFDDSDSDDDSPANLKSKQVITSSSGVKRQTQLDISKALTEDPNVFEYDNIYDDMKAKNEPIVETDPQNKEKPKPKYINHLLKFSETRKKESERRVERKIQKEREREGNEFEDKEQFVTNAYKEKLEEIRLQDLKDQKEQQIDDLLDVKKQNDLSGFYRNLLNNNMSLPSNPSVTETVAEVPKEIPKPKSNRQIRRRRSSSDESAEEEDLPQKSVANDKHVENKGENNKQIKTEVESSDNEDGDEDIDSEPDLENESKPPKSEPIDENNGVVIENTETPKVDKRELLIQKFTKRTVGEVFSSAQMRYFERKDKYIL